MLRALGRAALDDQDVPREGDLVTGGKYPRTTQNAPILKRSDSRAGHCCEVCGAWLARGENKHDRELHKIAALERIAAALENEDRL